MTETKRTFEDKLAVRQRVPVLVGLTGPSGSGKTFSALRLATGLQRVTGGDIGYIDTEARRALHYADKFKFRHLPFGAPFSPLDYLGAVEHFVKKGAKTIVVDSMSHEHEGPGGVLEMHDAAVTRMAGNDYAKRERVSFAAWIEAKSERRRFINSILQMDINAIFCFRAKEKIKIVKGEKEPIQLGWMPIAGEEFVYEMTVNCLLYPAGGGVPVWAPEQVGERQMLKLPAQFAELFKARRPLDEETGEAMAKWAAGDMGAGATVDPTEVLAKLARLGVMTPRVLTTMGRTSINDLTADDITALTAKGKNIVNKKQTVDEAFPPVEPGSAG
jgi:energy-coupling factor transporter ATP-binding protein EcfA2